MKTSPSLTQLLSAMSKLSASDLFVAEGRPPAARVHGVLRRLKAEETTPEEIAELLEVALSAAQRERFEEQGDLDAGLTLGEQRFRLNVSRTQGRVAVVARAVPSGALSFEELRLPDAVKKLARLQRGLVLVTGATGSGKSTTLAAMVHYVNTHRDAHVVTIEDPIEFVHVDQRSRISQREIGTDTPSFRSALRHAVRQSPDVILIGELRDMETMEVALSAALTGHLVLATIHTIDATQTLQRLLSYFPAHLRAQVSMDLSLALRGIVSQRLVPTTDGRGRVLAAEVLTVTPSVSRLLKEQKVEDLRDLMKSSQVGGILPFGRSLLELYEQGLITYDVGYAYASNPDEFALEAKGMSTGAGTFTRGPQDEGRLDLDMKSLLKTVLDRGASDLHLTVGRPPILRIGGELTALGEHALGEADMRALVYSILSSRQRSTYELEKELDFALALEEGRRFRVNAYYQKGRMAAALRMIQPRVPDPATLGLPPALMGLADKPHGLLMVVGPTGAGKSTTLACLIDRINRSRACRIITIEDPVEYAFTSQMATIDQREVLADTRSFSSALKYVLRQDPDVIMVGEMRDLETVSAVLTAAETGHLVLATLHSNDAIQAIDRVIDVFPAHQQAQARSQLAASLLGVVSQRLLRRADGQGRVAAFEMMLGTPAIRNVIREDKHHQAHSLMETARGSGMQTMDMALRALVDDDLISWEEALRYATRAKSLGPSPEERRLDDEQQDPEQIGYHPEPGAGSQGRSSRFGGFRKR